LAKVVRPWKSLLVLMSMPSSCPNGCCNLSKLKTGGKTTSRAETTQTTMRRCAANGRNMLCTTRLPEGCNYFKVGSVRAMTGRLLIGDTTAPTPNCLRLPLPHMIRVCNSFVPEGNTRLAKYLRYLGCALVILKEHVATPNTTL